MDGNTTDWRRYACERITGYRTGACDFDGLYMAFAVLAKVHADGHAQRMRPSVHEALHDFLAAAEPFAGGGSNPPAGAIEREIDALHAAIGCHEGH